MSFEQAAGNSDSSNPIVRLAGNIAQDGLRPALMEILSAAVPGGVLTVKTVYGGTGSILITHGFIQAAVIPAENIRELQALNLMFTTVAGTYEFVSDAAPVQLNNPLNIGLQKLLSWRSPANPELLPPLTEALQRISMPEAVPAVAPSITNSASTPAAPATPAIPAIQMNQPVSPAGSAINPVHAAPVTSPDESWSAQFAPATPIGEYHPLAGAEHTPELRPSAPDIDTAGLQEGLRQLEEQKKLMEAQNTQLPGDWLDSELDPDDRTRINFEPIKAIQTPAVSAPDRIVAEPEPPPPIDEKFTKSVKNISAKYTAITAVVALTLLVGAMVATAFILNENERTQNFNRGAQFLKDGYGDLAKQNFDKILQKDPNNLQARLQRAQAYLLLKDYRNALLDFDHVIALQPQNMPALSGRAAVHLKTKDFQKARELADEALKVKADDTGSLLVKAAANLELGEPEQAIAATTDIIARKPATGLAEAYATRGDALYRTGKYAEAREDYSEALKLNAKDRSSYAGRARSQFHLKKYDDAIADSTQAIFADATNADLYMLRAQSYEKQGKLDKALKDYDNAVGFKPSVDTYSARARAHMALKNYNRAAADFEEIIKDPKAPQIFKTELAMVRDKIKSMPVAPLDLESLVGKPQPQRVLQYDEAVRHGVALLERGEVSEAVKVLSMAVSANPRDVEVRRHLAHAMTKAGLSQQAITQFKLIETVNPLNDADKLSYAEALSNMTQYAPAAQMLEQLVQKNAENHEARLAYIQALLRLNKKAEAVEQSRIGTTLAKSPETSAKFQHLFNVAQTWVPQP